MIFTADELREITGGKWLSKLATPITAVCDDSRKCCPGCLFVAIAGELSDGHRFISQALASGASAVCLERQEAVPPGLVEQGTASFLLVEDSLRALQEIAHAHRMKYCSLPVLAVTGSCGKTSTKEMCAAIFEAKWPGRVLKTIGNTNNHFGVPRNLLRIDDNTDGAVIEAGSNHPGEIANLGRMIAPNMAIISCIGAAHLEFFHDLDGVAEEKGDIYQACPDRATVFMPADAHGIEILRRHAGGRNVVTFGLSDSADVRAIYNGLLRGAYSVTIVIKATGQRFEFTWGIGGECQAGNAAGAFAVGLELGLSLENIGRALGNCSLPGARMAEKEIGGVHWVNDAYNANPDSMLASLNWFGEISRAAPSRKVIIGDMLELGECSQEAHFRILAKAVELFGASSVLAIGERMGRWSAQLGVEHYPNVDSVPQLDFAPGTYVFLKASFSMALYKLVPEAE